MASRLTFEQLLLPVPDTFLEMIIKTDKQGFTQMDKILQHGCEDRLLDCIISIKPPTKVNEVLASSLRKLLSQSDPCMEMDLVQLAVKLGQDRINCILRIIDPHYQSSYSESLLSLLVFSEPASEDFRLMILQAFLNQVTDQSKLGSHLNMKSYRHKGVSMFNLALLKSQITIADYLLRLVSRDLVFSWLEEHDGNGWTALHRSHSFDTSANCGDILDIVNDVDLCQRLLMIQEKDDMLSVLTYSMVKIVWSPSTTFQSIIKRFLHCPDKLLKLAVVTDRQGHTAFHHAALLPSIGENHGSQIFPYFEELIKHTYTLKDSEQLVNALVRQPRNGKLKETSMTTTVTNVNAYYWALEMARRGAYMLFQPPSALIIFNRFASSDLSMCCRDEAEEEAEALAKALRACGIKVTVSDDLCESDMCAAIRKAQEGSGSYQGQIVAVMSHGVQGHICDATGQDVPISQLEHTMCPRSHKGSPKCLILQCCQKKTLPPPVEGASAVIHFPSKYKTDSKRTDPTIFGKPVYEPYAVVQPDFSVLMSSVSGTESYQNHFIPKLSETIMAVDRSADINDIFVKTQSQLCQQLQQVSLYKSTLAGKFCLKDFFCSGIDYTC